MAKKDSSLISSGIKHRLYVSFCLMFILPLLVSGYFISNYILSQTGLKIDVTLSIIISICISIFIGLLGFFLVKEVFDRILSVTNEARLIAAGDINRKVDVRCADEMGYLGDALNQLTQRIRSNIGELKVYGEKTTEINMEIQKRVLVLSSLLQISSLISQGAKLEEILKISIEKSRLLAASDFSYLFFREEGKDIFYAKAVDGLNSQHISQVSIDAQDNIFNKLIKSNKSLILDSENTVSERQAAGFYQKFKLKNTMALPIYWAGKVGGILGIGNCQDSFAYKKDDIELLDVFAKQIAIAIENDVLARKVEKLEIKDSLTGLYNETFIRDRLQEEIKSAIAYQRPCAFVILNIDNFQEFHKDFGALQAEGALKKVASLIKDSVTEIDRVARFGDNEFALVLPERNKRRAKEIAEEIRKKIAFSFNEEQDASRRLTVSGGVSENPLDGINADELIVKAKDSLGLAKENGKDRVVA